MCKENKKKKVKKEKKDKSIGILENVPEVSEEDLSFEFSDIVLNWKEMKKEKKNTK